MNLAILFLSCLSLLILQAHQTTATATTPQVLFPPYHMAAAPRVLMLPYPAQGHVIPMMELSHCLVEHGVRVTFVNTELNHGLILDALVTSELGGVDMVSIPDDLGSGEDRKDLAHLTDSRRSCQPASWRSSSAGSMPTRRVQEDQLADRRREHGVGLSRGEERLGVRAARFCPSAVAMFASRIKILEMICDGVLDEGGWPRWLKASIP